jgi:hypothetical protein
MFCFAHDPELAERRKAGNRVGAARANAPRRRAVLPPGTPVPALRTTKEVVTFLEQLIAEVRTGTLDPKIASTVGYLVGIQARAVGEVESREGPPAREPERPMTWDEAATQLAKSTCCLARLIGDDRRKLSAEVRVQARAAAAMLLAALDKVAPVVGPALPASTVIDVVAVPAGTVRIAGVDASVVYGGDGDDGDAAAGFGAVAGDDGAEAAPALPAAVVPAVPAAADRLPAPGSAAHPIGVDFSR